MGRPQSNGFIERFHCTLLDEHLRVKGRTTWYESVEEMQTEVVPVFWTTEQLNYQAALQLADTDEVVHQFRGARCR